MLERRQDLRVTINREFETIDAFVAEYATNISVSGCFIRSKHPLAVGTRVNLRFTIIAGDMEIIDGVGEVVRTVEGEPENRIVRAPVERLAGHRENESVPSVGASVPRLSVRPGARPI